jgi:hypothetical protein
MTLAETDKINGTDGKRKIRLRRAATQAFPQAAQLELTGSHA